MLHVEHVRRRTVTRTCGHLPPREIRPQKRVPSASACRRSARKENMQTGESTIQKAASHSKQRLRVDTLSYDLPAIALPMSSHEFEPPSSSPTILASSSQAHSSALEFIIPCPCAHSSAHTKITRNCYISGEWCAERQAQATVLPAVSQGTVLPT